MADKFKSSKADVFTRVLAPMGFEKGKLIYLRPATEQLHAIDFQASRWGSKYFVNIGFSYEFLPGFLSATDCSGADYKSFDLLDLLMHIRLDEIMPDPCPREWSFDQHPESAQMQMETAAKNAIACIDVFAKRWSEPATFLEAIPPTLLADDIREATRRNDLSQEVVLALPALPLARALGAAWYFEYDNLAYSLGIIASRSGRVDMAQQYLKIALTQTSATALKAAVRRLQKKLHV